MTRFHIYFLTAKLNCYGSKQIRLHTFNTKKTLSVKRMTYLYRKKQCYPKMVSKELN